MRATASGQTCLIDPNGTVLSMLEPFTEGYLAADIPVLTNRAKTVYTVLGDYVGILFAAASSLLLIFGLMENIVCRFHTDKKKAI